MKKIMALFFFGFFAFTINAQEITNNDLNEKTYEGLGLEVKPTYPGGYEAFTKYITTTLEKIRRKPNGRIYVRIYIEKDGSLQTVEILKGIDSNFDKEVIRILINTPEKWNPGMIDDKPVRCYYTFPISVH